MDLATSMFILLPLAGIHLILWRDRRAFVFQVLVDVALLALPGSVALSGLHLGPGLADGPTWGAPAQVRGSPEQSDLPLQFAVWWDEVRRLGGRGEAPWIGERFGGGLPLFAHGQTQIPFPLHAPVWLLGARPGTDVMVFWKLELAALGGFLLFRRLRLTAAAAALGAIAYAFGPHLLAWVVVPLAWVHAAAPWAMWLTIRTLRGGRRAAAGLAVILGALVGWSVHPESAAFLSLAVAGWATILGWGRKRRLLRLAPVVPLALAVSAVGALPLLLTARDSAKLAERGATAAYPTPGVTWGLRARVAALLAVPWREGHPGEGSWRLPFPAAPITFGVGATSLVWALAARAGRRHRRVRAAFAATIVGAGILVWQVEPVASVLARVPVLGAMVWPRAAFLVVFGFAGLAALGFDAWLRRPIRRRAVVAAVAVQVLVAALAVTAPARMSMRALAAALAPAAACVAGLAGGAAGGWLVPIVLVAEHVANGSRVLAGAADGPGDPGAVALRAVLARTVDTDSRVLASGHALPANLAVAIGFRDLRAADPVRPRGLAKLHQALGSSGLDLPGPVTAPWAGLAGAWGVRALVTPPEGLSGDVASGWTEVARSGAWRVYRNERACAAVRVATAAVPEPQVYAGSTDREVDFASTALVATPVALGGTARLTIVLQRATRVQADVQATGPVLAVLHVPRSRGWEARLDGVTAPIVSVDYAGMGVVVPAGVHAVAWQYSAPGLGIGLAITLAGLASVGVVLWRGDRREVGVPTHPVLWLHARRRRRSRG